MCFGHFRLADKLFDHFCTVQAKFNGVLIFVRKHMCTVLVSLWSLTEYATHTLTNLLCGFVFARGLTKNNLSLTRF